MKTGLIIVSIVAFIAIVFAVYFGMEAKKAKAANKVLDPNGAVTPAVVSAVQTATPAVGAAIAQTASTVATNVARVAGK